MKTRIMASGILLMILIFLVKFASAQKFSADIISKTKEGVFKGRVFTARDKVRMEIDQTVTISRIDKNVVWMLIPADKKYMELPVQPQNIVASIEDKMPGEIERRLISTESIDGKMTNKYEIVYETAGKRETVFIWVSKDKKFPIRTSAVDGSWVVEYRNVVIAKQPDILFEIPQGFQKLSYEDAVRQNKQD
jgi:hypothetical protein